ncbi:MAG TPA: caspase family protein [Vicinamibacterales bacterium]|nr:caspase family protein [Vicinamibacterales bacterium]
MNPRALAVAAALTVGSLAAPVHAAAPVQRFLLVIGANAGGGDRAKLQYAVSDAERFARVMVELGGVPAAHEVVLRQPRLKDLVEAFDALTARVLEARRTPGAGRTEVIVYYSGHADEQGLLLAGDRYSYRSLRDRLDQIPADVRIAVLDACASGAFTRVKGGKARPAFLVDESADMRGHAFLTSSAETESAQESDRIRASYFTHYLISGFRGAADLSGDGKVTLNEAYQFAFNETLGRTVDTRGGAQHPSYDINLSGSGDVVMTDVRQTTATLVLGEELDGRFFVRNAAQELVVELYKPFGRKIELGLEPGTYDVRLDREKTSMQAKTRVDEGGRVTLDAKQFGAVALEATHKRGDDMPHAHYAVDGRNRFELRGGMWRTGPHVVVGAGGDGFVGLLYAHHMKENLAITFAISAFAGEAGVSTSPQGQFAGAADVVSVPVGVRWNPFQSKVGAGAIKPYAILTAGPIIGSSAGTFNSKSSTPSVIGAHDEVSAGGQVGGGVDFHVARSVIFGLNAGYNWMVPFEHAVGSRTSYAGAELGLSFGFLFGKGR